MVIPSAMVLRDGDDVPVEDEGGAKCVSCSICLEVVANNDGRSWAKLQCGHEFHLDCIGSAFNVKGAMQCPNCRKIEKGQWLYANGCRSSPEFSLDDWTHDDDLYDLGYSEMAFHWCPFGQLPRVPSSFEDGDFPAAAMAYHDVVGQHAILAEQSPCPYVGYVGPMHPSSMADGTNHHWNGGEVPPTTTSSFSFSPAAAIDHHFHHSWDQPPPFSTSRSSSSRADQQRSTRNAAAAAADGPRSFMHPSLFVGPHSSPPPPPYPGSNARSRDRVQALQAYYQQQQPTTMRRSNSHRGSTSSAEQTYFIPTSSRTFQGQDNPPISTTSFHSSLLTLSAQAERDPGWALLHSSSSLPEPSGPRPVFRPRHGSDRPPSQHR